MQPEDAFLVFRKYDTNASGGLSADELLLLLKDYHLGYKMSDDEAAMAVKLLSKDGSEEVCGHLTFVSVPFYSAVSHVTDLVQLLLRLVAGGRALQSATVDA